MERKLGKWKVLTMHGPSCVICWTTTASILVTQLKYQHSSSPDVPLESSALPVWQQHLLSLPHVTFIFWKYLFTIVNILFDT